MAGYIVNIGDSVRILPPFSETFEGVYSITEIITHEDGQIVYILSELGGFAPQFLESV